MLKTTVQKTLSGSSVIKTDKEEKVVASMSASIQEDGSISINKYISDKDMYKANKDEVRADMDSFETMVYQED